MADKKKKAPTGPPKEGKKTVQKKVQKVVEDRTFGLKNKNKSKAVQKYVEQVQQQAKLMGRSRDEIKREEAAKAAKKAKKELEAAREAEMAGLFKTVQKKQVIGKEIDPKSVLCDHFKAGSCRYGAKCRFSHDMEQGRKVAKINLYQDPREVDLKEGEKSNIRQEVCKYFLDAVENSKYGWLWVCEDGKDCVYRHALPEGFVLKKDQAAKKKEEDDDDKPTFEEELEIKRKALDFSKCTSMTYELFLEFKERKKAKRAAEIEQQRKEAEQKNKQSKGLDVLSGRALFEYQPQLFKDDEGAEENYDVQSDREEDEEEGGDGAISGAAPIDAALFADDEDLPED